MNKKLISIVIPAYNEEGNILELQKRIKNLTERQPDYLFEIIIVENGSSDETFHKLTTIHQEDKRFKIVQLSRNFTADGAVAAGLQYANGDCAILMDADLQDPPEVIDEFIQEWNNGFEIVYGIIIRREGVNLFNKLVANMFYMVLNTATKGLMPRNVTAFRLIDRKVYNVMNNMKESNRFTRGLSMWTGFKSKGVKFTRSSRFAGESKAPFIDIFKEGLDAIFAFSYLPLKMIGFFGIVISVSSFLFLLYQLYLIKTIGGDLPGYPTLIATILFMFGALFLFLGIISEYLIRIYDEVKGRPLYVVRTEVGFNK